MSRRVKTHKFRKSVVVAVATCTEFKTKSQKKEDKNDLDNPVNKVDTTNETE